MSDNEKKPFERLPKTVKPEHYVLYLKPDLNNFTFDGETEIHVKVLTATTEIVVNAMELNLKSVAFTPKGGIATPAKVTLCVEEETAILSFATPIEPCLGKLFFSFSGELHDNMRGFYRSKYTSPSGEARHVAVTQFQAIDARRCFPCWDEPAVKATFDISLCVPHDRVALSNMPVASEEVRGNERLLKFERTPIMSTYLVAVVVGDFDFIEDTTRDGIKVRVYTPVGKKEQGKFALQVATEVLPYYTDYFEVKYPLPKIDLVAIPDFAAGAMENWGLVTYRELCLLVDPDNTTTDRKQKIAHTVGHELAHQWFGNLVTMEWWTHLWLNEGYATFVESMCVNDMFPEYEILNQFVTKSVIVGLQDDALRNSHAIEVPICHPSEIDEIFDDISYNKGASILRMLHKFIGDEAFRKGMKSYLTKHEYGNAETEDLWAALQDSSEKPVKEVMSTWTNKMGFPLITVSSKQIGNSRELTLSQKRFCASADMKDDPSMWMVPISLSTSADPTKDSHNFVLSGPTQIVTIDNINDGDFVKVNTGTFGFYRTFYPIEIINQMIPAITSKQLPPLDRLGILDDVFSLVQAGHMASTEGLKLMSTYAEYEDDCTVWKNLCSWITKLNSLFNYADECKMPFLAYARSILRKISEKLGWDAIENESHMDTLLRARIIEALVECEDEKTIKEAKTRFEAHRNGTKILPADLRLPVYRAVFIDADASLFEEIVKMHRSADLHEEKHRISFAMGYMKDPELLQKALDFAMSDDVRKQDTIYVISFIAFSKEGLNLTWAYLTKHWQMFLDKFGGVWLITMLVRKVTEKFASVEAADEADKFFADKPISGVKRNIRMGLETARLNAAWLSRDRAMIAEWLSEELARIANRATNKM
ncbi:puromycin-sensitive aminopeptidase isoform X1 [Cloeon dipterum]|uniref:puromycin-sensitive aminopeptidase isoform X1 n=1 Tax=Cloeon dipterum TaxID=197152 RepID=UPI00321FBA87